MSITEWFSLTFMGLGVAFFIAGTVGLLRFPDVYTRLHALTKADNVGLGMVLFGLCLQANSAVLLFKLLLVWFFVIFSGASSCYLVARAALRMGIKVWSNR